MIWFQHEVNAQDDIKLKLLRRSCGMSGIGLWWCLVEKVGKEGMGGYLEFSKYPVDELSRDWTIDKEELIKVFNLLGDLGLIDKKFLTTGIFIEALPKRADDYTKRMERNVENIATDLRRSKAKDIPKDENETRGYVRYFMDKHREHIGIGYSPNWARDCSIIKQLLEVYSKEEIMLIIEEFIKSSEEPEVFWADKVNIPMLKACASQVIGRLRKNGC